MAAVTGSCLCGAIRYEVTGRISPIALCHCSKCRKANGSAFHSGALCRKTKFRWLRGEGEFREYRTESGYRVRFCRHCGSPVPMHLEDEPFVVLHAGALDVDPGSRPIHHFHVGSKAPWYEIHGPLPCYDESAPADEDVESAG